eukprot:TRINITY_DN6237_c0_g2_i2.p1 TRINITY_DN6237_c0_g2~~TRINITY_DN6237_c0_g2_i2.p1  ORF type:complete len:152 (+),score=27.32 TRINITY_DN6237_c0_g2_i2:62-457(+)
MCIRDSNAEYMGIKVNYAESTRLGIRPGAFRIDTEYLLILSGVNSTVLTNAQALFIKPRNSEQEEREYFLVPVQNESLNEGEKLAYENFCVVHDKRAYLLAPELTAEAKRKDQVTLWVHDMIKNVSHPLSI